MKGKVAEIPDEGIAVVELENGQKVQLPSEFLEIDESQYDNTEDDKKTMEADGEGYEEDISVEDVSDEKIKWTPANGADEAYEADETQTRQMRGAECTIM